MDELEALIKELNLVFTGTMDKYEFASPNFNLKEKLVEYKNCISLYKLISDFNKQYNAFLEDYHKLDLLKKYEMASMIIYTSYPNERYRDLTLYVPSLHSEYNTIDLCEKNGMVDSLAFGPMDKNAKDLSLKERIIRDYLDLFEKYKELINNYTFFQSQCIYSDGCTGLYSDIEGYFLKGLRRFVVDFGNTYWSSEDFVTIPVNLGNGLSIDYKKSKIKLDNEEKDVTGEIAEKLLKRVYISNDILQKKKTR